MASATDLHHRLEKLARTARAVRAPRPVVHTPATTIDEAQRQIEHLQIALEHRTLIGQATGLIAERYSLGIDAAFEVLSKLSQDLNHKVYVVAGKVVEDHRPEG